MSKWQQWVLAGVVSLTPAAAFAVDPAVKCEAEKLKAVGKYVYCRMLEESKAARSFDEPDFSKCDKAFMDKWIQMEAKAASQNTSCWTTGDGVAMQDSVSSYTNSIADQLGLPAD